MTPQFALSLSVDGIKLLHRVSGGWHVVGEIGLDTADLSAAMADLRAKGEAIGPSPLRTKLLIPDDQIKYLAIDSTQTTEDDVHRALDGTTPYAIHELVIDFDRAGGRTHVAAVARDTLAEAEAFAVEHDFGPVCFAGIAAPYTFRSEIFFGPTAAAKDLLAPGETPVRDDASVVVIGVAKPKAEGPLPAAAPLTDVPDPDIAEPSPAPAADIGHTVEAAAEEEAATTTPDDDLPVFASRHRTLPPETEPKPADDVTPVTPAAAPTVPPEAAAVQPTFDDIPDDTLEEARIRPDVPAPIPAPPPAEEPEFTPLDEAPGEVAGPAAPSPRAAPVPTNEPLFTRRPAQDSATTDVPPAHSAPRAPLSASRSDSVADGFASIRARNDIVASRSTPVADDTTFEGSAPDSSMAQTETPPAPSLFASRPEGDAQPEPRETSGGKGLAALGAMAGGLKSRRKDKTEPAKVDPEAEKLTVFGQRKGQSVGGKPKYLGLLMTIGLLIFLFLVALWANTLTEDGIAGWFKRDQLVPMEEPAVEIASAPAAEPDPTPTENASVGTPAPSALTESDSRSQSTPSTPIVRDATGRVLSPAEADRIYAATGVYQRAPRLPVEPREATLEGFQEYAALPAVQDPPQPGLPDAVPLASDLPLQPQPVPPPAGTTYQRDLRGFILATPEGTVTPQGVLLFAGAPEFAPPARPGTEPIAAPASVPDVAAPDAQTEGLILISGRPPIVPPVRPDDLAPEAEAAAEDAETLDDPAMAAENGASPSEDEPAEGQPETQADTDAGLVVVEGAPDTEPPLRPGSIGARDDAAIDDDALATETPEGLIVIAGRPELTPPLRPSSILAQATPEPAVVVNPADAVTPGGISLASFKPSGRPGALVPATPIADPALVGFRPSLRPDELAPETDTDSEEDIAEPDLTSVLAAIAQAAPQSAFNNVTDTAIRRSPMPGARPSNFTQVVSNARSIQQRQTAAAAATPATPPEQQAAPVASAPAATAVSNATVAPTGPVSGGVARAATVDNAIRMRDMNLIGVYGRPNARRALIRMGNGRYVKVEVGSALDGGRVTAIGDSALNFVKSGRTYALQLPNG